jgi:hypothetical protein
MQYGKHMGRTYHTTAHTIHPTKLPLGSVQHATYLEHDPDKWYSGNTQLTWQRHAACQGNETVVSNIRWLLYKKTAIPTL